MRGPAAEFPRVEKTPADRHTDETETHPAYGAIAASRVSSGSGAYLHGSDFRHHNYMTITISRAERHRSLSRDWFFPRQEVIRVALSEAQWATFLSTPNSGSGTECTIERVEGEPMPDIAGLAHDRVEQFGHEMKRTFEKVEAALQDIERIADGAKLTKAQAEGIRTALIHARNNLTPNSAFVAKAFGEHMEKTVERARIEIAAAHHAMLQRAGLEHLGAKPVVELEDDHEA